jgi:hypothetical protein
VITALKICNLPENENNLSISPYFALVVHSDINFLWEAYGGECRTVQFEVSEPIQLKLEVSCLLFQMPEPNRIFYGMGRDCQNSGAETLALRMSGINCLFAYRVVKLRFDF